MKTLFTAFKGKNNTSFRLVSRLEGEALLLTNSFDGLERDILALSEVYDRIYMFGSDPTLENEIRIEARATWEAEVLTTSFDLESLSDRLHRAQIPHRISEEPGNFLCNSAYFHMLRKNSNTVFIHIPSLRGMDSTFMEQLVSFFQTIIQ